MLIVSTHKKVWSINFWNFSVRVFLDVLFRVFSFSKASSLMPLTFSFITF